MPLQQQQAMAPAAAAAPTEQTASAWLLDIPGGLTVAVAAQDVIYVYPEAPPVFPVPQTPDHVPGVVNWQRHLVPIIDLGIYLGLPQAERPADAMQIMVLLTLGDSRLGALLLEQIPERAEVADSSQCELPAKLQAWDCLTASCFRHNTRGAVPILDLSTVFGRQLSPGGSAERLVCRDRGNAA